MKQNIGIVQDIQKFWSTDKCSRVQKQVVVLHNKSHIVWDFIAANLAATNSFDFLQLLVVCYYWAS